MKNKKIMGAVAVAFFLAFAVFMFRDKLQSNDAGNQPVAQEAAPGQH